MLCPNCKKELIVVERGKIELDYCMFCEGFWFDNNEWNLLSERLYINDKKPLGNLYAIPKVLTGENIKNCPVCNGPMEKFMLFDTILDRCKKKHGIWFDKKEISNVLNAARGKEGIPVNFLGEVFYKN